MERQTVARGCGCLAAGVLLAGAGALLLAFAGTWAVGATMNGGPVLVSEIDPTWTVAVRGGDEADGAAAMALRGAIEEQCWPMSNGVRVLFNHAWYNALTSGYDARIWIEDKSTYSEYALYVWGHHVFLRDEVGAGGYVNRVLTCDLDASGWLALAR